MQQKDRTLKDVEHEIKSLHYLKKKQFKILVDDVDELQRYKGEFRRKTDFLYEILSDVK